MARELILVRNLAKRFAHRTKDGELSHQILFENLNFTQQEGEVVTFFGDNGTGKTTLLRILLGLEQPDSGTVLIDGCPPGDGLTTAALVPQGSDLYDWMTVLD